jgi:hypothetical protein
MPKSRFSAAIYLILVFASGAMVGAVANRLYMVKTVSSTEVTRQPPMRRDPEEVRRHLVAETREKVKLDDEQVRKLNEFYDDELAQFGKLRQSWIEDGRHVRAGTAQKIRAMLRPDQIPLFEQLQAQREAARKARMANEKKGR